MILYKVGRFLQLLGLIVAPAGVAFNVADPVRVPIKTSLLIAGVGVVVFIVGYLLQQAGRPS